nr:HlyD family type I secretion periplasmic adaptor subunit [uncultured Desulfobulbus sp.]
MKLSRQVDEILEYQPDAVAIEGRPVPGKIRWVLWVSIGFLISVFTGAAVLRVDRIVVARGQLITNNPTMVVQSLNTALIHTIRVQVGDVVEQGQELATLDATFSGADLGQLEQRQQRLAVQIRRIQAEREEQPFKVLPDDGDEGKFQQQLMRQRQLVKEKYRRAAGDRRAMLQGKLQLNGVQLHGHEQQFRVLRDKEGTVAQHPQQDREYRLRLLEIQQSKSSTASAMDSLKAEARVIRNELRQVESDWQRFVEERKAELMEEETRLRADLENVRYELRKAARAHELISLRAPEKGIVLKMAERSIGSVLQQGEPFIILSPYDSVLEAEVRVASKDIGRIRTGDMVRLKCDAFPFQRHDTLPGKVRVVSENVIANNEMKAFISGKKEMGEANSSYRVRIHLLSTKLRNVPKEFRLMPGMNVQAEIKIGTRTVLSYFLYPVIRVWEESLREP